MCRATGRPWRPAHPNENRSAEDDPQQRADGDRYQERITVQPAQLRVFGEVLDLVVLGIQILVAQGPADVGPEEAVQGGRVDVSLLIRVAVVVAVDRRPPENALLRRQGRR